MTMVRLTLRLQRWSAIAFGLGLGGLGLLDSYGFVTAAGSTAAARAAFGTQMAAIGAQFSLITPLPVEVGTMAGYVQWRYFGAQVPLLLAIWAVAAGTAAVRGDEDRGLLESWLAAGLSRGAIVAWRTLAFAIVLAAAVAGMAVLTWAGAQPEGGLGWGGLVADGLAAAALGLALFAGGVLGGQLVATRRAAAGLSGAVVVALFLLNGVARTDAGFAHYRWLSPFYWYERTNTLDSGGAFDAGATALLLASALVLLLLAWLAFARRDLGAPLLSLPARGARPSHRPSASPLLEVPVVAGLYEQRWALVLWAAGLGAFAYLMVVEAKPIANALQGIPALAPYLGRVRAAVFVAFLDIVGFGIATPVLATFAITQVARWAADDGEGRLEMILAAGVPRWRVVVERLLALAVAAALLSAVMGVVTYFGARSNGFELDTSRLLLACALMVPLCLCFAVVGLLLAGWRPRVAVGVLTFLTIAGYLITQLRALFALPAWMDNLSPFRLYGTPLSEGLYRTGLYAMLGIVLAGVTLALVASSRREVGR
jgi:ABC-2 type transport system permease protein